MNQQVSPALISVLLSWCFLTAPMFAQTAWTEHPDNPLMTGDTFNIDGIFGDPEVIKDGNQYVMYYGAIKGDFSDPKTVRIFRATSPDGIVWTRNSLPVLNPGDPGSWDAVKVEVPSVMKRSEGDYWMYYAGNDDTTEVRY